MGDLARSKGLVGNEMEKERLLRERMLLEKEHELLQRQASEVRDECQKMQAHFNNTQLDRKSRVSGIKSKQFMARDFIDPKDSNGYTALLRDAINFCETHEGCPFLGGSCKNEKSKDCRGIWIKMGATCQTFAEGIKRCIKEAGSSGK